MIDSTDIDTTLESYGDLPMQPTGSGVADLEITYEQMRLAEEADAPAQLVNADAPDNSAA